MDETGLAASVTAEGAPQVGRQPMQPMSDIDQIIAMLQQGMSPEELIQAGVPQELVVEAINMLTQASTQMPPEQEGLAGMMMQQG